MVNLSSCSRGLAAALLLAMAAPAAAQAPEKPKLIVTLVIDQFAADLFQQYRHTYTGGLKRLSRGVTFANGYQSHAVTETCPGHSTILTGRGATLTRETGQLVLRFEQGSEWLFGDAVANDLAVLAEWTGLPHAINPNSLD